MIISIKPWLEIADNFQHGVEDIPLRPGIGANFPFFTGNQEQNAFGAGRKMERNNGVGEKMDFYHNSVLAKEVVNAMMPSRGKQFLDGTVGGGGHSELFLEKGAHVIGVDQDADALSYASRRLKRFDERFLPYKGNFSTMGQILGDLGVDFLDGILLDLGVSSRQLDRAERGFSFRQDGPLDMRMDMEGSLTAASLVNDMDEESLEMIFREYGEEPAARKVAGAIVKARENGPITTTSELAEIVSSVIWKKGKRHPATKVFQALRIAVNRELEVLEEGLQNAVDSLHQGGVLAVITFHSLEDRKVKRFMRDRSMPFIDKKEWPEPRKNPDFSLKLPTRKAIQPTREEVIANPRARSAKLRVAIKL